MGITETPLQITFEDNSLLPQLFGDREQHLKTIEQLLGVTISARGNIINIHGEKSAIERALHILQDLYKQLKTGAHVEAGDLQAALLRAQKDAEDLLTDAVSLKTKKRSITPRTQNQINYIKMLTNHELVFALGPAGTGKTYLAVAMAVTMLLTGRVGRIVLSRPAVEAGERLGFLPGDLKEKIDPYLRPLYDALHDMLPAEQVAKKMESGEIEIAPLAFMRGRTLSHAFVILDEAQNTTAMQMKMFLTRMGEGSRMVVTGDLTQVDLPRGVFSGLRDAVRVLGNQPAIGFVRFGDEDVVRHPLVSLIVKAYDRATKENLEKNPDVDIYGARND